MKPHERLDEIQSIMSKVKQSPEGIITNYSNKLMWLCGGAWLLEKTTTYFFGKFQSFVSNLMAPQQPLIFAKCKLKYLYNCTSPMVFGCTFNVMSYNKNLIVGMACDAKVCRATTCYSTYFTFISLVFLYFNFCGLFFQS